MEPSKPDYSDLYKNCLQGPTNHPACDQLFQHLRPIFLRVAGRVARQFGAGFDLDDVLQEINLKLVTAGNSILSTLPSESSAAAAYFSVVAANAARDYYRARYNLSRGGGCTVSLDDSLDWLAADTKALSRMERDLLLDQIEENAPGDPRERTIFRLYYRQGFKATEIASIPALNLTTKGVESMLHRIAGDVRQKLDLSSRGSRGKSR